MTGRGLFWPRLVASSARPAEARARHDDAERFRRVMLPHMDAAYTLARYLTRDASAAEDVVQEAYLRAYRGFAGWRGEAPKAWLLQIVRNCFLNSLSGAADRKGARPIDDWTGELPPELIETASPESLLADKSEAAMLRATIEQLPEPFRETLILRELEELSYKEIAAIAQVPIGTIMSRLARARQMLADMLLSRHSPEGAIMSLHPDKLPLIHGLVDGELDAANTLAIETHLRGCGECRAELERIQAVRDLLAAAPLRDSAPDGLRDRIETLIDAEAGPAPRARPTTYRPAPIPGRLAIAGGGVAAHLFSRRWASGAVAGMIAACLVLALAMPRLAYTDTEDQLVQSHVRSLLVGHLVDIPTSNRHVVKPWFNGKVDFAPPVPDLVDEGFPLVGGRLDYVDDHEVAAIVYRRRLHVINLFVRPAHTISLPVGFTSRKEGYSLVRWTAGGLEYWAVSDIDTNELQLFHQLYTARATP